MEANQRHIARQQRPTSLKNGPRMTLIQPIRTDSHPLWCELAHVNSREVPIYRVRSITADPV